MKFNKSFFAAILLIALLIAACGSKAKKKDDLVTDTGPFPRYLVNIPAETPYAFAALEPVPPVLVDQFKKRFKPIYDQYRGLASMMGQNQSRESLIMMALLEEVFDKVMSDQGMASIGLPTSPTFVVYGVGYLPVMRMSLADREKFEAMVRRIEERTSTKRTEETVGDVPFWSYGEGGGIALMSYIGDDVVFGVTPTNVAQTYVPYAIGAKKPAKSFADANVLEQVQKEYGFQKTGVGFVNLELLANYVFEGGTGVNAEIFKADPLNQANMTAECVNEVKSLVGQAPRAVFGYDEINAQIMKFRGGIELTNGLGSEIAQTKTSLPLTGSPMTTNSMATFGFGFDVGKMISVARARFDNVRREPFQCAELSSFNRLANEIVPKTSLIPGAVAGIQGFVGSMSNFEMIQTPSNPNDPNSYPMTKTFVDGIAAVSADDPAALFDLMATFIPELANVSLTSDGTPVAFQAPPNAELIRQPHMVMTNKLLAMTSGAGAAVEGSSEMKRTTPATDSPFMIMTYDLDQISKTLQAANPNPDPQFGMFSSFLTGKSTFELIPESRGIFISMSQPLESN